MHIKKKRFISPSVMSETPFVLEKSILVASVLYNMENIKSTGQEIENLDISGVDNTYMNYWEE